MTKRQTPQREPGAVPLLIAILTDRPNLPDAACRGQHRLFDALDDHEETARTRAQIAARRLCGHCPHTTLCTNSTAAQPHQETT